VRPHLLRYGVVVRARLLCLVSLLVASLAVAAPAAAQLRRDTSPVAIPPVSLTAPDDALAMAVNPASLAFLSGWGVQYVHADADDREDLGERGDGLYAAMPLLFGISAGLSVDSVRPAVRVAPEERLGFERTMVSLGLAYRALESLGVGATARMLFGSAQVLGLFTLDLAVSWRPVPEVAISLLARDVTAPGHQAAVGLGPVGRVPRSFVLGLAVRPDETRALTIDAAGVVDDTGRIGARLAAEVEVPYVGRLLGAFEVEDVGGTRPDLRGTVGLAVDWGQYGVGGGVIAGDGFGPRAGSSDGSVGWYATARVEEDQRRGIPTGDVIAEVVLEGTGARSFLSVQRRLERALHDPRVRGVLLRMQGAGFGLAYAQELRQLVDRLEAADKPVVCSLQDSSGSELYACAGARRIVIDPAGGVRLYGPSMEIQHYGTLLRNLGVRADFVRIGRFKSAIEDYQDDAMGEGAREERTEILAGLSLRLRDDLARDRELTFASMQRILDRGPYLADEAVEAGLVDEVTARDELAPVLRDVFGGDLVRESAPPGEVDRHFGEASHVGVVVIDGELTDGENVDVPLLEIHTTGGRTASAAIDQLAADPAIAAIVVRIDTPGGSVLASDQIHRAIQRARRRKPVIASMGAIAASGGYYVASACDEIWAEPSTITGSIGVWFGKVDFEPIASRYGVTTEQLRAGAHGGAESLFRPFTAEERALLSDAVRSWYRSFLRRVAVGRGMRMTEVHALAQGRVYTGDRALELGLVDHLGGFASALERARQLSDLPVETGYEVRPFRPSSLIDYVLQGTGLARAQLADGLDEAAQAELSPRPSLGEGSAEAMGQLGEALSALSPEARRLLRMVYVMRVIGDARPLALLPMDLGAE
jgi:protease-4